MASGRNFGRYTAEQVDDYYRTGQWTDENYTELIRARAGRHGSKVFLTDGTYSLTYDGLYRDAQRLAVGLRRKGIVAGDRVAVQLPNWAAFVVASAALARIGAVMVPIMPIYRRDEVGHVVSDASIRMIIGAASFKGFDYLTMYEEIRRESDGLRFVVAVRPADGQRDDLRARDIDVLTDLMPDIDPAAADAELDHRTHPDDVFVIVYTSGTTSRPKGCVHTFNTYVSGARALRVAFGTTEDDVQFGPSPIAHTTGLVTSVLVPLLAGAASHLMEAWDPARGVLEIAEHRCTASVTATTFLQTLMAAHDENPAADLSSLRVWTCAGAPIPAAVVEAAKVKLPGTTVLSLYGRSENLSTTTCTVDDEPRRAIESDGRALPGAAVEVVDMDGVEVPRGTEGDVAFRGPSHMIGYLNRPEDTDALYTPDGFSRSGDLGVMDAEGYVRVTGRTKDIIIRGGMNISVREVEDKLANHPDLLALAVVAMPDERLGEKACCFVVAKPGQIAPTVDELRQYLLDRGVAVQKTPELVVVVEELPMTATGKIQKHILRGRAADLAAEPATANG